jgi:hypothetical protein
MPNRAYAAEKEKNQKFREVDNMLVKKQVIKNPSALKCAISVSPGLCVQGPNLSEKIMKLGNMHIIQQVATIIGAHKHAMSKCFGLCVHQVVKSSGFFVQQLKIFSRAYHASDTSLLRLHN